MRLTKKIPLLFVLSGLFAGFAIYIVTSKGKAEVETITLTNLEREAQLLIELIDRNLFERYHDTSAFPLSLGHIRDGLVNKENRALIEQNLDLFVRNYKVYRRILIFDALGNLRASNQVNSYGKVLPTLTLDPEKVKNSDWFQAVMNGQALNEQDPDSSYVSGPQKSWPGISEEHYDMMFARPLLHADGHVMGVWVNMMDFGAIESIVHDTYQLLSHKGYLSSEITLLDKEGYIIVDMDPISQREADYQRNFSVLGRLNLAESGVEGAILAVSGLNGSNISINSRKETQQATGYAHSRGVYDFNGLEWSVLIRVDADEAFAPVHTLHSWSLLTLLAGFLLVGSSIVYLTFGISRPLRSLAHFTRQLEKGLRGLDHPTLHRHDEIGEVGNSLTVLESRLIESDQLIEESLNQKAITELHRRSIDATTAGVLICDIREPHHPVVFVNRALENMTGYLAEEYLGRNCSFLHNKDPNQPGLKILKEAIEARESCTVILSNFKKDGTLFYNNLRLDPVMDGEGFVTHYIGVSHDVTERIRQEEARQFELEAEMDQRTQESRDSENRLRAVFDTAIDGMVVLSELGIILEVNRSLEMIFGYQREDMLGSSIVQLLPMIEEESEQLKRNASAPQHIARKKWVNGLQQLSAVHRNGRKFPVEVSFGTTKLNNQMTYVGVIRDITEQQEVAEREKLLQQELYEREVIYRAAFTTAAVGMARLDLEGRFIEVNSRLCESFGYEPDELLGQNLREFSYQKDVSTVSPLLKSLILGEIETFNLEKRYVKKSGEMFWVALSVSLIRDSDNKPHYTVAVIEDVTERKMFDKELKLANDQKDKLLKGMELSSVAGGICNWASNLITHEVHWDDNMYQLYGLEDDFELTHENWLNCVHPDDREQANTAFAQSLESGDNFNYEFRIINQSTQAVLWVKAAAYVELSEEGEPVGAFGVNIDVTREHEIREELEKETQAAQKANEAKSRFLATMSHEIRTPMNGVIGMIDLLKGTELDNEQKHMVNTVRDSSFSLLEVINDILDFSKIESGQMALEITNTSVLSVMEKTVESLWVTAMEKNVDVYIDHDFRMPSILPLDSIRLRQILMNLLGNAIKFTASPYLRGHVVVRSHYDLEKANLVISVCDTGVGMTLDQQSQLFKPFTQVDSSTTRKYGGTGLGLTISQAFAQMMGGGINVTSEKGQGSTFNVTIPMTVEEENKPSAYSLPYKFPCWNTVVDCDDPVLADICIKMVSQIGLIHETEVSSKTNVVISTQPRGEQSSIRTLWLSDEYVKTEQEKDCYSVNRQPMKPSELLFGLAILCDLESPDVDWRDADNLQGHIAIQGSEKYRILCAEDQPTNQLVISKQLQQLGFQFELVNNGEEALEALQHGDFDLLLTDCHMPIMDGYDLARAVRLWEQEHQLPRMAIIAVTASALSGESKRCLDAGMDDYITKPVEILRLKQVLSAYVESSGNQEVDDRIKPNVNVENTVTPIENEPTCPVDYDYLQNVIGSDDQELMNAILELFWTNMQKDLAKFEQAISNQDSEALERLAHGAKGAALASGLTAISQCFIEMERYSSQFDLLAEHMGNLKQQLTILAEHLKHINVL